MSAAMEWVGVLVLDAQNEIWSLLEAARLTYFATRLRCCVILLGLVICTCYSQAAEQGYNCGVVCSRGGITRHGDDVEEEQSYSDLRCSFYLYIFHLSDSV